jgi:cysteine-rich repeat protein
MSLRRFLILGIPLVVGLAVLVGSYRLVPSLAGPAEASPCKGTGETCRTDQSCCSRRCFRASRGAKFGECRPQCGNCGDGFLDPSCGEQCDDGNTANCDDCSASCQIESPCDDGVACTVDTCDPVTGCTHQPDDTLCDDGVACTIDTCDPVNGCVHQPDDMFCDDGRTITVDTCDPTCQPMPDATPAVTCDTTGCKHVGGSGCGCS